MRRINSENRVDRAETRERLEAAPEPYPGSRRGRFER